MAMTQDERRLTRHLVIAVLIKLAVLVLLWWVFVRDARVSVGTEGVATRFSEPALTEGASK